MAAIAVRNSSFAGAILAKAAFFQIDENKYDAFGRNIDTARMGRASAGVKEARKTPFMISAYSLPNA
ncbi:hypothetical protein RFM99_04605 [Mesorhizobium sp. VK4C]|uniref:hypothetical protein n=1 Tax=Mesorhizobium captivum TaxID=3072319 RepID=UPI002A24BF73|nr:hypothetical protein [Mesorhizobium sp. VK4C]MDX8497691.1 hypothetical protein [Mesorhizobium sp. VK4C]